MKYATLLITTSLLLASCSKTDSAEQSKTLLAIDAAEDTKWKWIKQSKPIEIRIDDRTEEELQQIGSLGVWIDDSEYAVEFAYDGESFKPTAPIIVDSSTVIHISVPFHQGIHLGDTLNVHSPIRQEMFGELLSITNLETKFMYNIQLRDITAALQIKLKSDNIEDMLQGIEIDGITQIYNLVSHPNGTLRLDSSKKTFTSFMDCLLNNGMPHNFFFIPKENSSYILINIAVNKDIYSVKTTIPPLRKGCITMLHLVLNKGKLSIGNSWVDTGMSFIDNRSKSFENVKIGDFLQNDGSFSERFTPASVAMVFEVDGKHGKAVALKDCNDAFVFGIKEFHSGRIYTSVDGIYKEGCISGLAQGSKKGNINENQIQYSPNVNYSKYAAFELKSGAKNTMKMLDKCNEASRKRFEDAAGFGTAYIPSLTEMISLANAIDKSYNIPGEFVMPQGFYTTCCESGLETYYAIDLQKLQISAYNSMLYPNSNLRLFYLF